MSIVLCTYMEAVMYKVLLLSIATMQILQRLLSMFHFYFKFHYISSLHILHTYVYIGGRQLSIVARHLKHCYCCRCFRQQYLCMYICNVAIKKMRSNIYVYTLLCCCCWFFFSFLLSSKYHCLPPAACLLLVGAVWLRCKGSKLFVARRMSIAAATQAALSLPA